MAIYGTALLSTSLLIGVLLGNLLGDLLGVDADVGGVGLAMIILILGSDWLKRTGRLNLSSESGITIWNALYIPIVVAMAASQNVFAALSGGVVAMVAGAVVVVVSLMLVGILSRNLT